MVGTVAEKARVQQAKNRNNIQKVYTIGSRVKKLFLLFSACAFGQMISVTATRLSDKPILEPGPEWTSTGVFNPTAVVRGKTILLFRATDAKMISRIGYAESSDGFHFKIRDEPVLSPTAPYEVGGGVEDPRVALIDGLYYLTYTGYNGKDAQLCLATSRDLIHWDRKGVILPAYKGTWNTKWTKSGAILPQKVKGLWWMYYLGTRTDPDGKERDYMGIANSPDLLHWTDASAQPVLPRIAGAFDSRVMEPGPAPILMDEGILLFYNGANDALVYGPAWALFDRNDPTKLIARAEKPFMLPELEWEKKGVVPNVVFLEGTVLTHGERRAYYGAADRAIGVARLTIATPSF
jgi:beta-1,2-mannosidase